MVGTMRKRMPSVELVACFDGGYLKVFHKRDVSPEYPSLLSIREGASPVWCEEIPEELYAEETGEVDFAAAQEMVSGAMKEAKAALRNSERRLQAIRKSH